MVPWVLKGQHPNSISIGSAVFCIVHPCDQHTDTQTMICATSVAIGCILMHCVQMMQPNKRPSHNVNCDRLVCRVKVKVVQKKRTLLEVANDVRLEEFWKTEDCQSRLSMQQKPRRRGGNELRKGRNWYAMICILLHSSNYKICIIFSTLC